jgi:P-type E1-E2 ATPase
MRAALARSGILVNDPRALEVAPSVDRVVLDKTGTLTMPSASLRPTATSNAAAVGRMEALVVASGHALARGLSAPSVGAESIRLVPGRGVEARIDGRRCLAGRPDWLSDAEWPAALAAERSELEASGASVIAYAEGDRVRALAARGHELRAGAAEAVASLRRRGVAVEILSGDLEAAVAGVAASLGVEARGGLGPGEKVRRIDELRALGERVAMAGDGINDAPALRAADVSIAMGSGTAAARSQAQVEVVGDDLRTLPLLLEGAHALRRVVRGNLAWTLLYNGVALAFAACGRLHPVIAAAAMVGSSLAVSVRSHRLLRFPGRAA